MGTFSVDGMDVEVAAPRTQFLAGKMKAESDAPYIRTLESRRRRIAWHQGHLDTANAGTGVGDIDVLEGCVEDHRSGAGNGVGEVIHYFKQRQRRRLDTPGGQALRQQLGELIGEIRKRGSGHIKQLVITIIIRESRSDSRRGQRLADRGLDGGIDHSFHPSSSVCEKYL